MRGQSPNQTARLPEKIESRYRIFARPAGPGDDDTDVLLALKAPALTTLPFLLTGPDAAGLAVVVGCEIHGAADSLPPSGDRPEGRFSTHENAGRTTG